MAMANIDPEVLAGSLRRLEKSGVGDIASAVGEVVRASGAARHARDLVTEACAMWDLPDLVGPASLVADELVTNGVEHAGTLMTLRISHRAHQLHLAVGDGSPEPPRLRPPRRRPRPEAGA